MKKIMQKIAARHPSAGFKRVMDINGWLVSPLVDFFLPPHCSFCGQPSGNARYRMLCSRCFKNMESTRLKPPLCLCCGRSFVAGAKLESVKCLNCRIKSPHFDRARALFPYRGPAGAAVKSFKYEGQYHIGAELVRAAFEAGWFPPEPAECDAVASVPLHRRRKRRRGYNQAELTAKAIAAYISKPYMPRLLRRIRNTVSQVQLAGRQRIDNVKGAFQCPSTHVPEHVLLVDDVLTTGATANECAKEIKNAGGRAVSVFTLVRTQV